MTKNASTMVVSKYRDLETDVNRKMIGNDVCQNVKLQLNTRNNNKFKTKIETQTKNAKSLFEYNL